MVVWILLPVYAKHLLYRNTQAFQAPVLHFFARGGEVQDYWALRLHSKQELIKALRAQGRSQSYYRFKLQQVGDQEHYIDRLERLLAMPPAVESRTLHARIVRRDVNAWFEQFEINRGSRDGVRVGQAVVSYFGLVGRVIEVRSDEAIVMLITSPRFRITVNTLNDARPITFAGNSQVAAAPLDAIVHSIPRDVRIEYDQKTPVFTSGLGGHVPSGIQVGYLVATEPETEGLFLKGKVNLDEGLRSLREVAVLIPLQLED
jgi:rod shape-determining protein MreC